MKITPEGIAVIEGDNYLSADIIAQKRLDVARDFLEQFRQYIPVGGVVVDVGACLGDYTATFSEMVGPLGMVFAFEPNPIVFECLQHNMVHYENVLMYPMGLGAVPTVKARMQLDRNNIGASRLTWTEAADIPDIEIARLDDIFTLLPKRLNFLKLDTEGWEPLVLDGAVQTINRFRPAILLEVNTWMLAKMEFTPDAIWSRLDALNYQYERFDGPYGDILCLPI
jgi:FkbM family methyltransferase